MAKDIGETLRYSANEPILLARLEEFFSPKPAILEFNEHVEKRLRKLTEQLGGVPTLIVHEPGGGLPQFDTYSFAAIQEILSSFERCRRSVCRTHVCFIASELYNIEPNVFEQPSAAEGKERIADEMSELFWEHVETSCIRLASFWDRIGQFLDFVFFNIRQYERDGFPSVMDRIASNYVRLFPEVDSSSFWTGLRNYPKSEKPDGFQWLIRRRNLLVHSVHLEAIRDKAGGENPLFTSAYNHLEESVHRKLKPGTPQSELELLHAHLDAAAHLFPNTVELCEHCVRLRTNIYQE